jgi:hypothetical protein
MNHQSILFQQELKHCTTNEAMAFHVFQRQVTIWHAKPQPLGGWIASNYPTLVGISIRAYTCTGVPLSSFEQFMTRFGKVRIVAHLEWNGTVALQAALHIE